MAVVGGFGDNGEVQHEELERGAKTMSGTVARESDDLVKAWSRLLLATVLVWPSDVATAAEVGAPVVSSCADAALAQCAK